MEPEPPIRAPWTCRWGHLDVTSLERRQPYRLFWICRYPQPEELPGPGDERCQRCLVWTPPPRLLRSSHDTVLRNLAHENGRGSSAIARLVRYTKGDAIFEEGTTSDCFYAVASGCVKISKWTPAGRQLIVDVVGPGDLLDSLAVYESEPFPTSAVALEDTVCLVVPRQAFVGLLERQPDLAQRLLVDLTMHLTDLMERLTDLSGGRVEARFARLFLRLADHIGQPGREGVAIPLWLSRDELASLTGTTVETAIRVMTRWDRGDIVRTERDHFVILDRGALEAIVRP